MEEASTTQIAQWRLESFFRLFVRDVWPCVWSWLLFGSVFIVVAIVIIKRPVGFKAASVWLFIMAITWAAFGTLVHFIISFGEAFASSVNPYRLTVYYSLTVCVYAVSTYFAWRRRTRPASVR